MATTIEITIDPSDECNETIIRRKIERAMQANSIGGHRIPAYSKNLAQSGENAGQLEAAPALAYKLLKRSVDARHGRVRLFMRYEVCRKASKGGSPFAGEANQNCKGGCIPQENAGKEPGLNKENLQASSAIDASNFVMDDESNSKIDNPMALPASKTGDVFNTAINLPADSPSAVIVGSGPAALFAALYFLRQGVRPVIIERGERTPQRKRDIAAITRCGIVDKDSNYCFGEGGAGTFSDGKLYTRNNKGKKRKDAAAIFRTLVEAGADGRILTDSHPHIGTDRLPKIINNIVDKITEQGGECRFHTRCTALIVEDGKAKGIIAEDTHMGKRCTVAGDAVLLAAGHSANDIYNMLYKTAPNMLAAKGFAVGVRAEHPRKLIDGIQYHGKRPEGLGAAEYHLAAQAQDASGKARGVYSFCMCPGGFVVPSATGKEQIVINGMSASGRNSQWSNSAIVMEVRAEDVLDLVRQCRPPPCATLSPLSFDPRMAGLVWRTWLENETYAHGDGMRAPAQRLVDFLAHKESTSLPRSSYTPGLVPSRLDEWLPAAMTERFSAAFKTFDSKIKGFITEEALLIAGETRTSSPVRILRNPETLECPAISALFAAGEGAGYAGGIVSSAMDGEKVAKKLVAYLRGNCGQRQYYFP